MSEFALPENLKWRKSSFSGSNGCVEVAPIEGRAIALRDSKNLAAGFFVYDQHEWTSFLSGVRNGEFDDLFSVAHAAESGEVIS